MDFIKLQALAQHGQARLMVILPFRAPSFEIQEYPSQRRIVEGVAIAIIQIAFGPCALGQQQPMRFKFQVEVAHATAPGFLNDADTVHQMLGRDQMAIHLHRVIRADAEITRRHAWGKRAGLDQDWRGFQTLYTPEGGTLDLSQTQRTNLLDLRAGAYSSVNILGSTVSGYVSSLPTVPKPTLNYLKTNQTYLGFNNVGLAYGSQIDRVLGGQGSDTIYVGTDCPVGEMTLDGGAGSDTLCLAGSSSDWSLDGPTDGVQVATQARNLQTGALLKLSGIEKLRFYNASTTPLTHSSLDLMA